MPFFIHFRDSSEAFGTGISTAFSIISSFARVGAEVFVGSENFALVAKDDFGLADEDKAPLFCRKESSLAAMMEISLTGRVGLFFVKREEPSLTDEGEFPLTDSKVSYLLPGKEAAADEESLLEVNGLALLFPDEEGFLLVGGEDRPRVPLAGDGVSPLANEVDPVLVVSVVFSLTST